jgi:hypothetical protein
MTFQPTPDNRLWPRPLEHGKHSSGRYCPRSCQARPPDGMHHLKRLQDPPCLPIPAVNDKGRYVRAESLGDEAVIQKTTAVRSFTPVDPVTGVKDRPLPEPRERL